MSEITFMDDKTKVNFDIGDLVRISESTHQEGMTPSRVGVITGVGKTGDGRRTGIYDVLFASSEGTAEMAFWYKYLEKISP